MTKYLMAQPSSDYFKWQVEVAIDNLLSLKVPQEDIVLLFTNEKLENVEYFRLYYPRMNVYNFADQREAFAYTYVPSIRPYLWSQFLKAYPEYEQEDFIYQDSDVIYKELPDLSKYKLGLAENHWFGADVEDYVGPDYINSKGKDMVAQFERILKLPEGSLYRFKGTSVGAHWLISKPKQSYWEDVYRGSLDLYKWLNEHEHDYDYNLKSHGGPEDYYVQVWCAEMYAELYICAKYGIATGKAPDFKFAWSTDRHDAYDEHLMVHNAGVTPERKAKEHLFYKADYIMKSPFDEDLSWVDPDTCSYEYVKRVLFTKNLIANRTEKR